MNEKKEYIKKDVKDFKSDEPIVFVNPKFDVPKHLKDSDGKKEETKQKFYVVGNGKSEEVSEETFKKESKIERKIRLIQLGIIDIDKCKELLFQLKKYFYGDFKYNESLQKVPDPNRLIQDAIRNLEIAIEEAMEIEINSV